KSSKIGHFSLILADFWRFLAFFCDFFDFSMIFPLFWACFQFFVSYCGAPGCFLCLRPVFISAILQAF
ncbi:MAG TPA: hypothetical protein PK722_01745, partial [Kiritimatiellia bacterium]|nr:hypothetical protein [Kiritimatiellia bacterium]